jgi:hypothetical protein
MIKLKPLPQLENTSEAINSNSTPTLFGSGLNESQLLFNAVEYFYGRVLNRTISSNELSALLNPKVFTETGCLYLGDARITDKYGTYIRVNGETMKFAERLRNSELGGILLSAVKFYEDQSEAVIRARSELDALSSVLSGLSKRTLSDLKFDALTNSGTFIELGKLFNGQDYLIEKNSTYMRATQEEFDAGKLLREIGARESILPAANILNGQIEKYNEALLTLDAFEFFLPRIVSRQMGANETKSRLTPGAGFDSGKLYIGSDYVCVMGNYIRNITPNDKSYAAQIIKLGLAPNLIKVAETIERGGALSNSLSALLTSNSGVENMPDIAKQLFSEAGEAPLLNDLISLIQEVSDIRRLETFRTGYIRAFIEGKSFANLSALFESYDYLTEKDGDVRKEFRELLRAKRQIELTLSAVEAFKGAGSVSDAVTIIKPLLESKNDSDKKAGELVLEVIYRAEIANLSMEARSLLTNGLEETSAPFLERFPLRSTFRAINYREKFEELRNFLSTQTEFSKQVRRFSAANDIRRSFEPREYRRVIDRITDFNFGLPDDEAARKKLFKEAESMCLKNSPAEFDTLFKNGLVEKQVASLLPAFNLPQLGRNTPAMGYLAGQFGKIFNPLLQTLRQDPISKRAMNEYLGSFPGEKYRERKLPYEISIEELEKRRPITDIERTYLESVKYLSRVNPALVAMMSVAPDETLEYMRAHFDRTSKKTWDSLKDGDYVQVVGEGLGAHGIAAQAEIARLMPELAAEVLWVDKERVPGGVFSIPEGPAWELNSANARSKGFVLPDLINGGIKEIETVRAYSSPVRWYPGERSSKDPNRRGGSINMIAGYLLTPDSISKYRYPTNDELALVAQAQAALVAKRLSFETELVDYEKNTDSKKRGDKILTFERTKHDGTKETKRIYCDAFIPASGLGLEDYGFKIKGTRAEKIINQPEKTGAFPKISHTLAAFNALASKRGEAVTELGETIAIWGSGNSTDTLLEYFGNLFAQSNPIVRNVKQIIVIASKDPSSRPRYARIADLRGRNGQGNLVVDIRGTVTDVAFDPADKDKLNIYGKDEKPLRNEEGDIVSVDHSISAAGFKGYLKRMLLEGTAVDPAVAFKDFNLPTAGGIKVAETLFDDPDILIVGTASEPKFNNDKKRQLPISASNALARVGVENAVALGFRIPETEAGIRIWLWSREFDIENKKTAPKILSLRTYVREATNTIDISKTTEPAMKTSRSVTEYGPLASAIFTQIVRNDNIKFMDENDKGIKDTITFKISMDRMGKELIIDNSRSREGIYLSKEFYNYMADVFSDPYLKAYTMAELSTRRRSPELQVDLVLFDGRISVRQSFID